MFKFIRESFQELAHVVWPTKKESRTYMWYTVTVIVSMTIFLSSVGYAAHFALKETRQAINPNDIATKKDLQDIYKQFGLSGSTVNIEGNTGTISTNTGTISTNTGTISEESHTENQEPSKPTDPTKTNTGIVNSGEEDKQENQPSEVTQGPDTEKNTTNNSGTTSSES